MKEGDEGEAEGEALRPTKKRRRRISIVCVLIHLVLFQNEKWKTNENQTDKEVCSSSKVSFSKRKTMWQRVVFVLIVCSSHSQPRFKQDVFLLTVRKTKRGKKAALTKRSVLVIFYSSKLGEHRQKIRKPAEHVRSCSRPLAGGRNSKCDL